jgi:phosphoribosylaminoimidazole-succinocarboxamide synthase
VALPSGLVEGSKLPAPVFTPTTKAPIGDHDEFIGFDEMVDQVGKETAEMLRDLTVEVYRRGADLAAGRGPAPATGPGVSALGGSPFTA